MWDTAVYTAFSMKYVQTTTYIFNLYMCIICTSHNLPVGGATYWNFPAVAVSTWPGQPSIWACVLKTENRYEIPIDQIIGPSSSMDMLTFIATLLHNKVHLCSDIH